MRSRAPNHHFKMSGGGVLPIERVIQDLCEIAVSPRDKWPTALTRLSKHLHVTTTEAGVPGSLVAHHARALAKQIPHINADAETEMRGVMRALANVLQTELNAKHMGEAPRRFYARD